MQITPEQVGKFQAIYKAKFGREISRELAYEQGVKLIRLMEIIYKPMTLTDYEKSKKASATIKK
jgi:uncharacterized tellurite resistance protein B-like protein